MLDQKSPNIDSSGFGTGRFGTGGLNTERLQAETPDASSYASSFDRDVSDQATSESDSGLSRILPSVLAKRIPVLKKGQVALVGAGPGDPGLLTINALMLIQQADVVVCDRLVSPEIVALKPASAELINAGKSCRQHVLTQDQTNQLLVDLAKQGKRVVRLKGGDPYIFGRGGEEVEVLMANQVESIVVPGITSASGCSAYAGFPLTHRDYAQSVTFITGHRKQDGTLDLDWPALASDERTVVFYMGLSNADMISSQLQAHGRSGETPVGLIERGTTTRQRVAFTTLDKLVTTIEEEGFKPPTMMIVGEVVTLAEKNQQAKEKGLVTEQIEQACNVG